MIKCALIVSLIALIGADSNGSAGGSLILTKDMLDMMEEVSLLKRSVDPIFNKIDNAFWPQLGVKLSNQVANAMKNSKTVPKIITAGLELSRVEIKCTASSELLSLINATGNIIFSSIRFGSILADIPTNFILELASRDDVRSISPPSKCQTKRGIISQRDVKRDLIVNDEGVVAHRVNLALQKYPNYNGNGVKVGVLSDSADYLSTVQASGNLPSSVKILPGQSGSGTGEGTAMMEIIYKMAPGASLYFATGFISEPSFAQNILDLAAAGCRVIVDDVGYLDEAIFEDGIIAQAVDEVAESGVAYFSAAGNTGSLAFDTSQTYQSNYNPVPMSQFPFYSSFSSIQDIHGFSSSEAANGASNNVYYVSIQWSDPYNDPVADYDLYVFGTSGNLIGVSASTSLAFEGIELSVTTETQIYFVVARHSGPIRFFSLNTEGGGMQFTTDGNMNGHPAASGAFGIAATPVAAVGSGSFESAKQNDQSLNVEYYSSDGPRQIFFVDGSAVTPNNFEVPGGLIRNKPDFTGADGVSSATPGFDPFYGTSAAAPHCAAIAALAFSANPSLTLDELTTIFQSTALDILTPGYDVNSGYGILDALNVLDAIGEN